MPRMSREFSPEFKRETVVLLESSGRPLMQVTTAVIIAIDVAELASGGCGGAARSLAVSTLGLSLLPTPADQVSGITRLNGAALAWRVQSGLNATCAILRASAHLAAMSSAPLSSG